MKPKVRQIRIVFKVHTDLPLDEIREATRILLYNRELEGSGEGIFIAQFDLKERPAVTAIARMRQKPEVK